MHHQPDPAIDFTTPEGLRTLLIDLNARNAWATDPVAAELMVYATAKYLPIAKAWRRDPGDTAYEAFLAMRKSTTVRADDPWAVITRAVSLGIAADTHADRYMTSQDKARRPSKRPTEEPVRAGEYEEYLYDVHPHSPEAHAQGDDSVVDRVIRTACVFLVATGWPAKPVEQAVDYIAHRIAGLSSHDSAVDVVTADLHMAVRLGYQAQTWRDLVRLVAGAKTRGNADRQLGLFARALLGDDVSDLLEDPDLVASSRRTAPAPDRWAARQAS